MLKTMQSPTYAKQEKQKGKNTAVNAFLMLSSKAAPIQYSFRLEAEAHQD
jgi:hypothetical protein